MSTKRDVLTYSGTIVATLWASLLIASKTIVLMVVFIISAAIYLLLKHEEKHEAIK